MSKFLIVVEWNGYKHIAGSAQSAGEAHALQASAVRRAELTHQGSRLGSNAVVRVMRDALPPRSARTRGTYLKSWR